MIKIEDLVQLKAFARQDGAVLSLLWIISFAAVMYLPQSPIGNILALTTPFVVGWRLCSFRDNALGGYISFRRSFGYSVYTFIYASLIFALAQYLYFRFLDGGRFCSLITMSATAMADVYRQAGMSTQDLNTALELIQTVTPISWAFVFMMQNILIGVAASLPVAAVCRRLRPVH